ncbi:MAG: guanylate kinase [Demequinaceae bacterium]|nr:guanylate kinase [Demequinaceae bacterium]
MSRLTVLVGPTAVGKGTIVRRLVEKYGDVWVSVSVTTRPRRPGEEDGVDYTFVTEDDFQRMIEDEELLEWAVVHGTHRYGTPRRPVEEHLAAGVPSVLEIDLAGARQVRAAMPRALFVFVVPPSWEELVRRLTSRDTENEEERARRLSTARIELEAADEFDAIVVNDDLDEAVDRVHVLAVGG